MKFYGKKGSRYEVYFGICPWVQIRFWRYLWERFCMSNRCLATGTQLKARGFDLIKAMQRGGYSYNDTKELLRIEELCGLTKLDQVAKV